MHIRASNSANVASGRYSTQRACTCSLSRPHVPRPSPASLSLYVHSLLLTSRTIKGIRGVKRIANAARLPSSGWKRFNKRTCARSPRGRINIFGCSSGESGSVLALRKSETRHKSERERKTVGEIGCSKGAPGADISARRRRASGERPGVVEREAKHVAARVASRAPQN